MKMSIAMMTYNIRVAGPHDTGEHAWEERRPVMKKVLEKYSPDVLCTQEGTYDQLSGLEEDLPDYRYIGLGREGGSNGEFMAIFYKNSVYRVVAYDHFWLSETPEVIGSVSWESSCTRMATWVLLEHRGTRESFYVLNTHLDHISEDARRNAAHLLLERAATLSEQAPLVLTGDFNSSPDSQTYGILTENNIFKDTWAEAEEKKGAGLGTFIDYTDESGGGEENRIDWVLITEHWKVKNAEIVDGRVEGRFASDHSPVFVNLEQQKA
ncbi:endonuclease/exonuclease/phosphatase family protein [Fictibacillus enclensis]|uniref:endonuclease/exonuclease/phosphatase family protein n=1 Tax=Fictibacillus enclensis TaxID=1017270 RepID=UPI0025A232E5|nr:endonuclease/exonuclease/phosphatase family protein [Fictibacillus enclensis]MDM5340669.1 endonuclease/exonuclease/phosphatase family protein [Fictibacillus enclensis]